MSAADPCQPEWFVAMYADGGLDAAPARRVETHLVHCERCRRRVLALREEARELGSALRASGPREAAHAASAPHAEDARTRAREREKVAPALALGLPFSIAAAAGISLLASAAFGLRLPAFLDWLHPARIMGVNNMFWNLLFWLRDESRGLFELAVGLGAVAGLAALGSFLLNALVRRQAALPRRRFTSLTALLLGVSLGVAAWSAPPAQAALDWRESEGEDVHIKKDERVDGLLIVNGETVNVEGHVLGDAVVLAERIQVSGVIEGNLILLGRDVEVTGAVQGNVIAAGRDVEVTGAVAGDAFLAASEVEVASAVAGSLFAAAESIHHDARVGASAFLAARQLRFNAEGSVARDLTAIAEDAVFAGRVGRDLAARAAALVLSGSIARDVLLRGQNVSVVDAARVGGSAEVVAPADALALAEGARIAGGLTHTKSEVLRELPYERFADRHFYLLRVIWLTCEFCIGLLLYWLLPGLFRVRVASGGEFFLSLAAGVASLPLVLFGCVLLAVTVVGIPLALLTLLLYLMAGYLAFLAVAALTGRLLTRPRGDSLREFGLALLAGLLLMTLLVNLPFIGRAAWWVLLCLGLGLLVRRAVEAFQLRRALSSP